MFTQMRSAVESVIHQDSGVNRFGLSDIPSLIQPITAEQLRAIPNDSVAITCACGGTNWIFTITKKHSDGTFELMQGYIRPIPEHERTHTFKSLIAIIADEIMHVVKTFHVQNTDNVPIAISFGFPQSNVRLPNGDVDARISGGTLPKMWRITDCDENSGIESQPSLANLLRAELEERGIHTRGRIVFTNDTTAVVLDAESAEHIPTLPVGFVFGTGINAAVYANVDRGIINLETGRARIVPPDPVSAIMEERGWVPPHTTELEHWIGGAYLPKRTAGYILHIADQLTDAEQVARKILSNEQQTLLSDIAAGDSPKNFGLHIGPSEYPAIRNCVRTVLHQAGQLIGMNIAAVLSAIEYSHGRVIVPYEGSLYAKGYSIQQTALQTVRTFMPNADLLMQHASGMRGVAKLALVLTHQPRPRN